MHNYQFNIPKFKANKLNILFVLSALIIFSTQIKAELIFKNSFDDESVRLNDTGLTWGADYLGNNNTDCTSDIAANQDCNEGRDLDFNDDTNGIAGFDFTKIDALGNELPVSATNWSCTKDNITGLLWENKSDDSESIHYRNEKYRWGGITHLGSNYGSYFDDWDILVSGTNDENLCGRNNWQVPTDQELLSLYSSAIINMRIDSIYFPYVVGIYWSSYPSNFDEEYAIIVRFSPSNAVIFAIEKSNMYRLMLVSQ